MWSSSVQDGLSSSGLSASLGFTALGHFATIPTMRTVPRWLVVFGLGTLLTIACTTPTATPTSISIPTATPTVPQYQSQQVVFEGAAFDVELAITPEQRARGLMGREHLGDREGMLFIYGVEGPHRFWMRGMVIPLDMVWIDGDGVVAGVTANVPPAPEGTIPAIYSPPRPILYVLESNAGLADAVGIRAGSQARFAPVLAGQ